MKFTQDSKVLAPQIEMVVKAYTNSSTALRTVMVSCVLVAMKDSNTTPATQLIEALKGVKELRTNALIEWFETNGPFTWGKAIKGDEANGIKAKPAGFKLLQGTRSTLNAQLEMMGLPKFAATLAALELKKEAEYKGFDLNKQVYALIAKATKIEADEGKASDKRTNLDGLTELKALMQGTTPKTPANDVIEGSALTVVAA